MAIVEKPAAPGRLESDNVNVILTRAFLHAREFAEAVEKVEQKLRESGSVIRIRHELDYDSTGDPAVYFRIVMPDSSLTKDKLLRATDDVANALVEDLDLPEQWGVYPYFRFRSQSEQEKMQELSWAER
ncbi:MAG: hypothetical protein ACLQU1_42970 [Bryobacteraceae bacterium]